MREFEVKFQSDDSDVRIDGFTIESYCPEDGSQMKQPEVNMEEEGKCCVIILECDHSERSSTAEWFNETVYSNKKHIIHTHGGDNPPNNMYCAFKGILTINGVGYPLAVGMNSRRSYNRWNIASENILASSDEHDGWLLKMASAYDTTYRIKTDGSYKFQISIY